jgi:glycosyltransferase involved in cell wall biosynthesis
VPRSIVTQALTSAWCGRGATDTVIEAVLGERGTEAIRVSNPIALLTQAVLSSYVVPHSHRAGNKVVHLTTVHRPNDIRIFLKEASTLAQHGYDVTLLACAPESNSARGVTLSALTPPKTRLERMTVTAWSAYRAALRVDADLYHFHDVELIPVGALLKLHGKKVIYDVHEDVAKDIADKAYLPRWLKPVVRLAVGAFERGAALFFDAIVAATTSIAANFPADKTVLIRNVPMLDEIGVTASRSFRNRSARVAYFGGLAPFNGVEQMVRAMGQLPMSSPIRLTLGGRFSSTADEEASRQLPGYDRVDFHGWTDRVRMAEFLADARAALVVYQPTPNTMECEPNKFFEALSAGLPLIASDFPHWRSFIERYQCGVVVPPGDVRAIAGAITELVENPDRAEAMGRRGRAIVEEEYNWESERLKLLALYDRLLQRVPSATETPSLAGLGR